MDSGDYIVSSACRVSLECFQQSPLFFSGLEKNTNSSEYWTTAPLPSHTPCGIEWGMQAVVRHWVISPNILSPVVVCAKETADPEE